MKGGGMEHLGCQGQMVVGQLMVQVKRQREGIKPVVGCLLQHMEKVIIRSNSHHLAGIILVLGHLLGNTNISQILKTQPVGMGSQILDLADLKVIMGETSGKNVLNSYI